MYVSEKVRLANAYILIYPNTTLNLSHKLAGNYALVWRLWQQIVGMEFLYEFTHRVSHKCEEMKKRKEKTPPNYHLSIALCGTSLTHKASSKKTSSAPRPIADIQLQLSVVRQT